MTDNLKVTKDIDYYSRQLRLPGFRTEVAQMVQQAQNQQLDHATFLRNLMEIEYKQRIIRRKKQRIKRAGFPYIKYLQDVLVEELPQDAREKLTELSSLKFIEDNRNIILSGNPGTGKTHLAIGLAIKACQQDYSVYFTTIPRLINQINEARSNRTLRMIEAKFEKYDLVVCDEFGYISYDKNAAELLFTHLSIRCGNKATIITTNLAFDRWNEIFIDEVLTAAMVDRLTHKAIFVNMIGQSYRIKETKKLNQNAQKLD